MWAMMRCDHVETNAFNSAVSKHLFLVAWLFGDVIDSVSFLQIVLCSFAIIEPLDCVCIASLMINAV